MLIINHLLIFTKGLNENVQLIGGHKVYNTKNVTFTYKITPLTTTEGLRNVSPNNKIVVAIAIFKPLKKSSNLCTVGLIKQVNIIIINYKGQNSNQTNK